MVPLAIRCPDNVWPKTFTGVVAIAVVDAADDPAVTLWLLLAMKDGELFSIGGMLVQNGEMPEEVRDSNPSIIATARREIWSLITHDKAAFYRAVESKQVHIGGDFRIFGRYTPSLVRLTEDTALWGNIDAIIAEVKDGQRNG